MPQQLAGVDAETIGTVIFVVGTIVSGTVVGLRAGLKKIRGEAEEGNSRIVGGVIMGSVEMALLSERLRENTEARREGTDAERELAHQMERLRDKL